MSPCSAKPRREPSASAGRPQMLCGNRTVCLGSHNIWRVQAEDKHKKLKLVLFKTHISLEIFRDMVVYSDAIRIRIPDKNPIQTQFDLYFFL